MSRGAGTTRLAELAAKVDAFFARVAARHPGELACAAGCAGCCGRRLTVTGIEAAAIRALLEAMPPAVRGDVATRAAVSTQACAALDDAGRCAVYAARPLVCRSHGLPIRFAPAGARHLPVVDACELNFVGRDLAALDPADVLDQQTLSTVLAAIDAADCDATGRPRGERVDLAAILVA